MTANSKIFIASKKVYFPGTTQYTGKDHLYLIYDLDGDTNTSNDRYIIRSGPESEGGDIVDGDADNIKIEAGSRYDASSKDYDPSATSTDRNYTELSLPQGKTADQAWSELVANANRMGNGKKDLNGRLITDVPYSLPYAGPS